MSLLRSRPRAALANRPTPRTLHRNYTIQEGDRVLFSNNDDNTLLSQPIRLEGVTHSRWGDIAHNSLMGINGRQRVRTDKGKEVTCSVPTLSEYVTLTPRMVTPVYPADANFLTSLLDIHTSPEKDEAQLEILEAGTGHGSLTLHLARAIHAANTSKPDSQDPPDESSSRSTLAKLANPSEQSDHTSSDPPPTQLTQQSQGAVIHTVDVSARYSEHAKRIVHGFRRGLYSGDVTFHVANVSDWLDQQFKDRKLETSTDKSFLDHIIIDMPDSYQQVEKATSALRANGNLLLFNPSITQLISAVEEVRTKRLPLFLERVVELGPGLCGGKEWDVRAVKPRALLKAEQERSLTRGKREANRAAYQEGDAENSNEMLENSSSRDGEQSQAAADDIQGFQMICRPKAFARLVGGGFLGLWRKKSVPKAQN